MKEIKTWQYILILFAGLIVLHSIPLFADNSGMGFFAEVCRAMVTSIFDVIIAYIIGLCIDVILRKLFEKTLVLNIIITLAIYESLKLALQTICM